MKTLSLTQPYATLIAIGAKKIETRSWSTSYRGPLAIHAAKGFPKWAREFTMEPVCYEAVKHLYPYPGRTIDGGAAYPLGFVVATCRLVDCQRTELFSREGYGSGFKLSDQERAFGDYSEGRWAWILDKVEPITPFPAKGSLGLWECEHV